MPDIHIIETRMGMGGMLHDAAVTGAGPEWFEPDHWRRQGAVTGSAPGRGTALFVQSGDTQWALRHYRRGGVVGRVIDDSYLWTGAERTRSFRELRLLAHLHDAGLPVPRPVAARYVRSGFSYRADLLTERLLGVESLTRRFVERRAGEGTWAAVGYCIRRFHDAGVYHADLNADNLLLSGDDRVFVIDFDRGRLRSPANGWKEANLSRLHRSLCKRADQHDRPSPQEREWTLLETAYRREALP